LCPPGSQNAMNRTGNSDIVSIKAIYRRNPRWRDYVRLYIDFAPECWFALFLSSSHALSSLSWLFRDKSKRAPGGAPVHAAFLASTQYFNPCSIRLLLLPYQFPDHYRKGSHLGNCREPSSQKRHAEEASAFRRVVARHSVPKPAQPPSPCSPSVQAAPESQPIPRM